MPSTLAGVSPNGETADSTATTEATPHRRSGGENGCDEAKRTWLARQESSTRGHTAESTRSTAAV
eukprot:scaffold274303_cov23-Tisochrysis_lutea.AAC.1